MIRWNELNSIHGIYVCGFNRIILLTWKVMRTKNCRNVTQLYEYINSSDIPIYKRERGDLWDRKMKTERIN